MGAKAAIYDTAFWQYACLPQAGSGLVFPFSKCLITKGVPYHKKVALVLQAAFMSDFEEKLSVFRHSVIAGIRLALPVYRPPVYSRLLRYPSAD